jgi:hypothetical protein
LASTTHVPLPTKDTAAPEIEQTPAAGESMVNRTGLPEPPPAAVTVYIGPPAVAFAGGVDVKVIVCGCRFVFRFASGNVAVPFAPACPGAPVAPACPGLPDAPGVP